MKTGVFIKNFGQPEYAEQLFQTLNKHPNTHLFYQEASKSPSGHNFPIFNSTDLWYFEGNLIVNFLDGLKFVNNLLGGQRVIYYFQPVGGVDLISLVSLLQSIDVEVIADSSHSAAYLKNKTNLNPVAVCPTLEKVLEWA